MRGKQEGRQRNRIRDWPITLKCVQFLRSELINELIKYITETARDGEKAATAVDNGRRRGKECKEEEMHSHVIFDL